MKKKKSAKQSRSHKKKKSPRAIEKFVAAGKSSRFQSGKSGNPGGRPKALISDATRDWLKAVDAKTGKTNAELVAQAQGKKALKGETNSYCALRDTTEGRPAQTQQHEVISSVQVNAKIEAPDLLSTLRQIYGLGSSAASAQPDQTVSLSEGVDRRPESAEDRHQGT